MIYSIKNFLCKLFIDFFQFSWQISLRKMYLISEELVLAMLSDSGFSVLDSDDDSLSRSYAAAAAADMLLSGAAKSDGERISPSGRASERNLLGKFASFIEKDSTVPDALRLLEKNAGEIESLCIKNLLEKKSIKMAKTFGFFGREVLKAVDKQAPKELRQKICLALASPIGECPEKIAGAIWALSRGNLARVALSRGQLKKYRAVFLEIAANFEKRFAIAGNAATPLSD